MTFVDALVDVSIDVFTDIMIDILSDIISIKDIIILKDVLFYYMQHVRDYFQQKPFDNDRSIILLRKKCSWLFLSKTVRSSLFQS